MPALDSVAPSSSACISPSLYEFYTVADKAIKEGGESALAGRVCISPEGAVMIAPPLSYLKGVVFRLLRSSSLTERAKAASLKAWQVFQRAVVARVGQESFDAICARYKGSVSFPSEGALFAVQHIQAFYTALSQITVSGIEDVGVASLLSHRVQLQHKTGWGQWLRGWFGRGERLPGPQNLSQLNCSQITGVVERFHQGRIAARAGADGDAGKALRCVSPTRQFPIKVESPLDRDAKRTLDHLLEEARALRPIPIEKIEDPGEMTPALTTHFAAWLETFCKKGVNQEWLEDQLIPVPVAEGKVEWYRVAVRIGKGGLVAYALLPMGIDAQCPPLVVFRPTQTDLGAEAVIEALHNDMESCIGLSGWQQSEAQIAQHIFQSPLCQRFKGKWFVAGYSLGGAHAQRCTQRFREDVAAAYFFNAPGIEARAAQEFAAKVNAEEGKGSPLAIHVIRTEGDLVPNFGDKTLGWGVEPKEGVAVDLFEASFAPEQPWSRLAYHRASLCSTPCLSGIRRYASEEDLSVLLDNSQRGTDVEWCQRLHSKWGWLALRFVQLILLVVSLWRRLLGITPPEGRCFS